MHMQVSQTKINKEVLLHFITISNMYVDNNPKTISNGNLNWYGQTESGLYLKSPLSQRWQNMSQNQCRTIVAQGLDKKERQMSDD